MSNNGLQHVQLTNLEDDVKSISQADIRICKDPRFHLVRLHMPQPTSRRIDINNSSSRDQETKMRIV